MMSKNQRGDTIIEVLFAMTIIGVVLSAAYAVASKNLQVSQLSKERTQATEYAIAQVDQLKTLKDEPADGLFCVDVTQAAYIIDETDPACTVNGFTRLIEKNNHKYRIEVNWVPPGGEDSNRAIVEFFYDDFDFNFSGSTNIGLSIISAPGNSALLGVNSIITSGVSSRGIVWGTTNNPQLNDGISNVAEETPLTSNNSFTINLTGLSPSTIYYVRGFVVTTAGVTEYSGVTTINGIGSTAQLPSVITSDPGAPNISEVSISGNVISEGSSPVVERGFVYGTSPYPTLFDNKVASGGGPGVFNATITGLAPSTNYYVRAYAQNADGTSYDGSQKTFTTIAAPSGLTYEGSYNGSTYFLSDTTATLAQARTVAASSGGHLVTITSASENNYVASMAGGQRIWMGFSDTASEGNWVWDTGEPVTYENWSAGEPNDYNLGVPGEDGAVMNWTGPSTGTWNDWYNNASTVAFYVIEYD